jgi:hypothetical protein
MIHKKITIPNFLIVFWLGGFFFRLWMAQAVPQPFAYDQNQYYGFVLGILREGLHADTVRLYGYPLIVAPIIALFGVHSPLPWTIFHAFIDCTTALLVYWLSRRILGASSFPASITAYILYLFNPYTSAYVGVLLTEIVAIFLVTGIVSLFYIVLVKKRVWAVFLLAFFLGYLPQVRPSFIYFTVIGICLVSYLVFTLLRDHPKRTVILLLVPFLYMMPYAYNVITNLKHYGQFSLQSVDKVFVREVYVSLFIERGLPDPQTGMLRVPPQVYSAWSDFSSGQNPTQRSLIAKKYWDLSMSIIRRDPYQFLFSRIRKLGYIWEKHYLFPYRLESTNLFFNALIYRANFTILLFSFVGFLRWLSIRSHESSIWLRWMRGIIFFLFFYISVAHIFSTSEERFSLPAYPLIMIFAGFALVSLPVKRVVAYIRR